MSFAIWAELLNKVIPKASKDVIDNAPEIAAAFISKALAIKLAVVFCDNSFVVLLKYTKFKLVLSSKNPCMGPADINLLALIYPLALILPDAVKCVNNKEPVITESPDLCPVVLKVFAALLVIVSAIDALKSVNEPVIVSETFCKYKLLDNSPK